MLERLDEAARMGSAAAQLRLGLFTWVTPLRVNVCDDDLATGTTKQGWSFVMVAARVIRINCEIMIISSSIISRNLGRTCCARLGILLWLPVKATRMRSVAWAICFCWG
jgi:hypothetical protein